MFGFEHKATTGRFVAKYMSEILKAFLQDFEAFEPLSCKYYSPKFTNNFNKLRVFQNRLSNQTVRGKNLFSYCFQSQF